MNIVESLLTIALVTLPGAGQGPVTLSLSIASPVVEGVCRLDDGKYLVNVRIATVYRNDGRSPIAVVPDSETFTGADYTPYGDTLARPRAQVRFQGTVVLKLDPSGPWTTDQMRVLQPAESHEGSIRLAIVAATNPDAKESDIVVAPGRYSITLASLIYARSDLPLAGVDVRFGIRHVFGATGVITIPELDEADFCGP